MDDIPVGRILARWAAGLTYRDLPASVLDKIRALVLFHLVSGNFGIAVSRSQRLARQLIDSGGFPGQSSVLGHEATASLDAAAFLNCEFFQSSGLIDSYQMLTHPGSMLLAAGLAAAEQERRDPRELMAALAAGYEVSCRLADRWVPSMAAHGFRPSPIYGTLGAAVVAGKLLGLDEDGLMSSVSIAAGAAGGLNEPARAATGDMWLQEPIAARQGIFSAVLAAATGGQGTDTIIDGEAGFLYAFAGSRDGRLSYAFEGALKADARKAVSGLGRDYHLLDVMFRMYDTAGYNQPVIELLAELKEKHRFAAEDIEHVTVLMNYLETTYPSPEYRREGGLSGSGQVTGTRLLAAAALAGMGMGVVGRGGSVPAAPAEQPAVLCELIPRVTVAGVYDHPLFSPAATVQLRDGTAVSGTYPYARMTWNFDQVAHELRRCMTDAAGRAKLRQLTDVAGRLEHLDSVGELYRCLAG